MNSLSSRSISGGNHSVQGFAPIMENAAGVRMTRHSPVFVFSSSILVTRSNYIIDMPAICDRGLPLNLIANTAIFYLAARLYLLPQLPRLRPKQILVPILLLHSTRHLGMMFLTRGATYPGLSSEFAYPAAFGDLLTAIIALVAIPIVLRGSALAKPAVWFFNIFGTLDLVTAITLATIHNAPVAMGPAYWIPAFWVPLLLVSHYVTFIVLLKHWNRAS
jgi:hypothetical protein